MITTNRSAILSTALGAMLMLCLYASALGVPPVPFKAGRYAGTIQLTTTVENDPYLSTKTTFKVKGRSTGDTTLQLLGPPQTGTPALPFATDDFPYKIYRLEAAATGVGDQAVITEPIALDGADQSIVSVSALVVKGNRVTAEASFSHIFKGQTFNIRVIIKLTRIGP